MRYKDAHTTKVKEKVKAARDRAIGVASGATARTIVPVKMTT